MKITKIISSMLIMTALFFSGCKPKDADIKASVEEKLKTNMEMPTPAMVNVNDGVVTLSGECKDEACKAKCAELANSAKGVKSVVNNLVIAQAPVVTAPVVVTTDDALTTGVKDAVKDFPTVTAVVNDGIVTLTGEIKRDRLQNLIQSLNTLKPKKIENQLTIK
ncbi:MAG: BON domain-containing protein [Ferruginibacter sp.]